MLLYCCLLHKRFGLQTRNCANSSLHTPVTTEGRPQQLLYSLVNWQTSTTMYPSLNSLLSLHSKYIYYKQKCVHHG